MPLALGARKDLISAGLHSLKDEVKFIGLIFPRSPKSACLWQHRRWCLLQLHGDAVIDDCSLQLELNLCSYLSDIYPKNYYAWTHRLWLLNYMDENKVTNTL
jgi:hypothetical protein